MDGINYKNLYSTPALIVTASLGIGFICGLFARKFARVYVGRVNSESRKLFQSKETGVSDYIENPDNLETKLVLVVRNDLKMGKGKAAAQCAHAAVLAYQQTLKCKELLTLWTLSGQRKVVLKVESEQEMLKINKDAKELGLITSLIRDAGHTQVISGTRTVLGVGPANSELIDTVTGHLKLY